MALRVEAAGEYATAPAVETCGGGVNDGWNGNQPLSTVERTFSSLIFRVQKNQS